MDEFDKGTKSKDVGEYRISFYPGLGNTFSVVRAWRIGAYPSTIRDEPYPSWQLYEGDYETALALYKMLEEQFEIERRCDPMKRNPRITRAEEIAEFRANYPDDVPEKRKKK